jgi:hypothetical protein
MTTSVCANDHNRLVGRKVKAQICQSHAVSKVANLQWIVIVVLRKDLVLTGATGPS